MIGILGSLGIVENRPVRPANITRKQNALPLCAGLDGHLDDSGSQDMSCIKELDLYLIGDPDGAFVG